MGTFFEEQARALMKLGHQVGIIYPEYSPFSEIFQKSEEQSRFVVDDGLPTYSVFVQTKIPKLRKLSYKTFCKAVSRVYDEYVSKHSIPDIIHAHSIFFGGIAAFHIAGENNIPFVITEHLTAFIMGTINHEDDRELSRKIFHDADASVIVSNNFKGDLEKELSLEKDIFHIVHNMVADLFFEDFSIKEYKSGDEFILFTNSFLLPRKNHKLIFEAIKILIDKKINVKLHVGGDGPLRDELIKYASDNGMAEHINFVGGLKRTEVKNQLINSHAFVLASFYETFGVVLIESLACGRPVITTDSGGPRDFVNEKNGKLVREFSPTRLAAAIEQVITNYNNYNQKEISGRCYDLFNEKKIATDLEKIYEKVLKKK